MQKQEITVGIPYGIHAVPSVRISSIIKRYEVEAVLCCQGRQADGANCLSLMTLRAEEGSKVTVQLEGEKEAEAMEALASYMKTGEL